MTAEEYCETKNDMLKNVPKEFRAVLDSMAYEQDHAYGRGEVLVILEGLVMDLSNVINNFGERKYKEGYNDGIKKTIDKVKKVV